MTDRQWVELATYPSGLDADIAIARLEAAGIPALRDASDGAGIFGASFQGPTAFGVTVRVPSDSSADARALLEDEAAGLGDGVGDDDE